MDARVHHVQGKTELVNPADMLGLLQELHREKLALYRRHEAGARQVSSYEFNNTYQYILNREDAHVSWLRAAIEELGAVPDEALTTSPVPGATGPSAEQATFEDDARSAREFVERWQVRVEGVTHARHRKLIDLILGEVREHQRFFEHALAGRNDLLGRRPPGSGTGGGVMATRWIE
jgi:hypothetical protein